MGKHTEIDGQPIHVTRWEHVWIEGGVLYSRFWSGPTAYVVSQGLPNAFDGVARTRKVLGKAATVLPLQHR